MHWINTENICIYNILFFQNCDRTVYQINVATNGETLFCLPKVGVKRPKNNYIKKIQIIIKKKYK